MSRRAKKDWFIFRLNGGEGEQPHWAKSFFAFRAPLETLKVQSQGRDEADDLLTCLIPIPDVIFHDDLARLRSGFGPENMAVVKHMAMNLIRNPKDRHSLKSRRKLACLNDDYLQALIEQKAPLT